MLLRVGQIPGISVAHVLRHSDTCIADVRHSNRLDANIFSGSEQTASKGRNVRTFGAGAFGKHDEVTPLLQMRSNGLDLFGRTAWVAFEKKCVLQPGQLPEDRPRSNVRLCDEGSLEQAAEHKNIQVGNMVCNIQRGLRRRWYAFDFAPQRK